MERIPNLTGSLVTAMKFTYRQIVLLVLLSLSFWLVSAFVVTIGAAMIALFRTIRRVPEEHRSDFGFLKAYFRDVRRSLRAGLPLSALAVGVPLATLLHFGIALSERSGYFLLAGLLGIYATLLVLVFTFRVANVLAADLEQDSLTAFGRAIEASRAYPYFFVLQSCLFVGLLALSIVLPPFILMLFPGVAAVVEILLYEEASDATESPIRHYLTTFQ